MTTLILILLLSFGVQAQELYTAKECPEITIKKSYYEGAVLHIEAEFFKPLELKEKVYCKAHTAYISGFVGNTETILKGGVKGAKIGSFVRQVSVDAAGEYLYVLYDVFVPMPGELVQWKVVKLTFINPSVEIKEGKWKRG